MFKYIPPSSLKSLYLEKISKIFPKKKSESQEKNKPRIKELQEQTIKRKKKKERMVNDTVPTWKAIKGYRDSSEVIVVLFYLSLDRVIIR